MSLLIPSFAYNGTATSRIENNPNFAFDLKPADAATTSHAISGNLLQPPNLFIHMSHFTKTFRCYGEASASVSGYYDETISFDFTFDGGGTSAHTSLDSVIRNIDNVDIGCGGPHLHEDGDRGDGDPILTVSMGPGPLAVYDTSADTWASHVQFDVELSLAHTTTPDAYLVLEAHSRPWGDGDDPGEVTFGEDGGTSYSVDYIKDSDLNFDMIIEYSGSLPMFDP